MQRIRSLEPSERREQLLEYVAEQVATVLGLAGSEQVSVTRGLFEMGMDSLMSVELKNRLESGLGHPLASTLRFNYPNVGALTGYLMDELNLHASAAAEEATRDSLPGAAGAGVEDGGYSDEMSEDDLAAMLASRLRELR